MDIIDMSKGQTASGASSHPWAKLLCAFTFALADSKSCTTSLGLWCFGNQVAVVA